MADVAPDVFAPSVESRLSVKPASANAPPLFARIPACNSPDTADDSVVDAESVLVRATFERPASPRCLPHLFDLHRVPILSTRADEDAWSHVVRDVDRWGREGTKALERRPSTRRMTVAFDLVRQVARPRMAQGVDHSRFNLVGRFLVGEAPTHDLYLNLVSPLVDLVYQLALGLHHRFAHRYGRTGVVIRAITDALSHVEDLFIARIPQCIDVPVKLLCDTRKELESVPLYFKRVVHRAPCPWRARTAGIAPISCTSAYRHSPNDPSAFTAATHRSAA